MRRRPVIWGLVFMGVVVVLYGYWMDSARQGMDAPPRPEAVMSPPETRMIAPVDLTAKNSRSSTAPAVSTPAPDHSDALENAQELERMKKSLPGNQWLPDKVISPAEGAQQLKERLFLEREMASGQATVDQKRQLLTLKIRETHDKIQLIEYIQQRTQALSKETGKTYLSATDVAQGNQAIQQLQQSMVHYQAALDEVQATRTNQPPARN